MNMGGHRNSIDFPWNRERRVTLKYGQGIKKTVSNCNRSIANVCQNKITVSEYNNQKY